MALFDFSDFLNTARNAINVSLSGTIPIIASPIIANGESLSNGIDARGKRIANILIPSVWTTANLTFQSCTTIDGIYNDLYDDSGLEVTIIATPGKILAVSINAIALSDLMYLKIRSGTAEIPIAQGAERTLTVILA